MLLRDVQPAQYVIAIHRYRSEERRRYSGFLQPGVIRVSESAPIKATREPNEGVDKTRARMDICQDWSIVFHKDPKK